MAELLALSRTALDSESSDGEEIYPLRNAEDIAILKTIMVRGQEGDRDYDVFLCKSSMQYFLANFFRDSNKSCDR